MADKTIDDLTALGAAPAGGSYVPVWESGATKKVTVSNLLTNAGGGIEFSSTISSLGSETGQIADGDTLLEGLAKTNDRLPLSGGTLTGSIVPPNNAYAFESPTRSIGFGFWDGQPAIVAGSSFPSSFDDGFTLASNKRIGWSSTTTGGSAWRDTALERESAGVIVPYQDDTHDLGSSTKRFDDIHATNTTIQSSDERLKTEVQPVSNALDLVNRLNPVSYKWKDYDFETTHTDADGNVQTVTSRKTHSRRHWGLIAQEFKTALENAGLDPAQVAAFIDPAAAGQEGNMGIRYGELVAVALAAIKELSARVEALEA